MSDGCQILAELALDERAPERSGRRLIEWASVCGISGVVIPHRARLSEELTHTLSQAALSRKLTAYVARSSAAADLCVLEPAAGGATLTIGVNRGPRFRDWCALQNRVNAPIGYTDELSHPYEAFNAAISLRVPVIVKGLTLNRSLGGSSHRASLYPDEFSWLVEQVRDTLAFLEQSLERMKAGLPLPETSVESDAPSHTKSFVAGRRLPAGHRLQRDDLKVIDGPQGLSAQREGQLIGSRLLYECPADEPITFGLIAPWDVQPVGEPLDVSVVIRAKNEGAWLRRSLAALVHQSRPPKEIIVVDNESTDETAAIAASFGCRVPTITDREFSFGRALNRGIAAARSPWVVSLSAHCIPVHDRWLEAFLVGDGAGPFIAAFYGRQEPLPDSSDFDKRDLWTTFGAELRLQRGQDYFFHNANSIVRRSVWTRIPFDETLHGVEDRDWAKKVLADGHTIVYVPLASVHHYHGIHQGRNEARARRVVKVIELIQQREPAETTVQ